MWMRNRNTLRARRAFSSRKVSPVCSLDPLEPRTLLSAVTPAGTLLASSQATQVYGSLAYGDPASGTQVNLTLSLSHAVDAVGPGGGDVLTAALSISRQGSPLYQASLRSVTSTPAYSVTVSAAQDTLHFVGSITFASAAQQQATVALDLTWSLTTVQSRYAAETLTVSAGQRLLVTSTRTTGDASLAGAMQWGSLDPALEAAMAALTGYPAVAVVPGPGALAAARDESTALPTSANLQSLMESLAPTAQAPAGAQITVQSAASASATVCAAGTAVGSIGLSRTDMLFPAQPITPPQAWVQLAFSTGTGTAVISEMLGAGASLAADAASADLAGAAAVTVNQYDAGGMTSSTAALAAALHWQGTSPQEIVLGKSTLATAQGVTTHYDQSVTRAADITGTLSVAGMPSLACTEGTITQSRSVTIVAPGPTAPVPFSPAQQISPRDWKSLVTQPWRDTTLLVKSIGLTKLRGSAR